LSLPRRKKQRTVNYDIKKKENDGCYTEPWPTEAKNIPPKLIWPNTKVMCGEVTMVRTEKLEEDDYINGTYDDITFFKKVNVHTRHHKITMIAESTGLNGLFCPKKIGITQEDHNIAVISENTIDIHVEEEFSTIVLFVFGILEVKDKKV
jgi:hypothetical protein